MTKRVVVVMRRAVSSVVVQVVGALGLLVTLQLPLLSQVVTYCPGANFYSAPDGGMSVSPEVPSDGIGMLSASGVGNRLGRDPHRINGWVEVFVVGGRGSGPKGALLDDRKRLSLWQICWRLVSNLLAIHAYGCRACHQGFPSAATSLLRPSCRACRPRALRLPVG